jgi:protein-tyrosine phosphatase
VIEAPVAGGSKYTVARKLTIPGSPMHDARRILQFPDLLNVRDLGGYPTLDGQQTRWRSLLRADDLVQLTPAGVAAMAQFGVETVVDLRWPEEVEISPHPIPRDMQHVRYHQISLLSGSVAQWVPLQVGSTKEMWKCAVLEHTRSELKAVLSAIAAAPPAPLLFHCVAGKDRTGIIAALLLALADVVPEAIAYDYAASAEQLREAYLQRYANSDPAEIIEAVRCPEEGVHNMLEYLAKFGGVRGYFEEIGLTGEDIARLRARLRESA